MTKLPVSKHFGIPRKPWKSMMFFLGLLLITGACSILGISLLMKKSDVPVVAAVFVERGEGVQTVRVLVPRFQIEAGKELQPVDFAIEERPALSVSPRSVKNFEELTNQYARAVIQPGQPLSRDYLTAQKPINHITANIPVGFRAVTINVDSRSSVEGWVRPGANVDVTWASSIRGQPALTVIVHNAKVLSVERQVETKANPGAPVPSTVSLLVSIRDAAKIQLAVTTGSLSLNLRGDMDPGKTGLSGSITTNDLLGMQAVQKNGSEGIVKIRGKDGALEELTLQDGKLQPVTN